MPICCNRREEVNSTPHTFCFSCSEHAPTLLHITLHGSRLCWDAFHIIHMVNHVVCLSVLDSLFLALFRSVCFSYQFYFYLNRELNLFLREAVIGEESGSLAENTPHILVSRIPDQNAETSLLKQTAGENDFFSRRSCGSQVRAMCQTSPKLKNHLVWTRSLPQCTTEFPCPNETRVDALVWSHIGRDGQCQVLSASTVLFPPLVLLSEDMRTKHSRALRRICIQIRPLGRLRRRR